MVMVVAMMPVMVVLSKGGCGKQQCKRKNNKLLHTLMVASGLAFPQRKFLKELPETVL